MSNQQFQRWLWAGMIAAHSSLLGLAYMLTRPPLLMAIVISSIWVVAWFAVIRTRELNARVAELERAGEKEKAA